MTLVYYGLRDGEIRCLDSGPPREARTRPQATRNRHDSHPGGDVDELIESLRVVARPHHAPRAGRTDAWQPSHHAARHPGAEPRNEHPEHQRPTRVCDHARPTTLDKPRSFTDAARRAPDRAIWRDTGCRCELLQSLDAWSVRREREHLSPVQFKCSRATPCPRCSWLRSCASRRHRCRFCVHAPSSSSVWSRLGHRSCSQPRPNRCRGQLRGRSDA